MFNLFWYAVFRPCPVAVFVVQNSFVIMTDFSRQDLVEMLNKNGISPAATNFRERVEKYILIHFDLLKEELVDPKKYKNLCVRFASVVKGHYAEADGHLNRMFEKHEVIIIHITGCPSKCIFDHFGVKIQILSTFTNLCFFAIMVFENHRKSLIQLHIQHCE